MSKPVAELLKDLVVELNNAVSSNPVNTQPIYDKYEVLILRKIEKAYQASFTPIAPEVEE